jgi:hypothetical protein
LKCAPTISPEAFRQALDRAVKEALGKRLSPTALGAPPIGPADNAANQAAALPPGGMAKGLVAPA